MAEVVVFADAAQHAANYLRPLLGVTTVAKIPTPRPTTFVTVQRVGGVNRNRVVDSANLDIQCWAGADYIAHDLAQTAWAYLRALDGGGYMDGVFCYRCDTIGGPAYLPDPDSTQPRYVMAVELSLRGTPI